MYIHTHTTRSGLAADSTKQVVARTVFKVLAVG